MYVCMYVFFYPNSLQEQRHESAAIMETVVVSILATAIAIIIISYGSTAAAVNVGITDGDEGIKSGSTEAEVASKTMRDEECQVVVMDWLQHDFNPKVDSGRAALRVEWGSLDAALASAGCHPRGDLRTELWRVLDKGSGGGGIGPGASGEGASVDFGTQQYFAKFRRCQHLSPDHFAHHETRSHEVGRTHDEFHHVVERNYVIRLCPCPSRNDSARCECEDLALCSALIDAGGSSDNVFPWCQQPQQPQQPQQSRHRGHGRSGGDNNDEGDWKEGHVAAVIGQKYENELRLEAEFPAPKVDCMSASLSGTLVSCTPIIPDYDRVKVVFHRVYDEETESCSSHTAVHNVDVADVFFAGLTKKNLTHGDFQLDVFNLTADANYCVTVELDGHPYCHPPLIVGHVGNELYRQPAVCRRQNVETALKTTKECSSSASYVMGFRGSLSDSGMITLIVAVVCVAICIVIVTTACSSYALRLRRRDKSKSGGGVASNLFLAAPNVKNDVGVESIDSPSGSAVDVFLVYLSDSPLSEDKNAVLREWLGSLATVNDVFDLSDPERQEAILSLQEEWVTTVMEKPNLRVVAVTATSSSNHYPDHRGSPSPLTSHVGNQLSPTASSRRAASTAAATASDEECRRLLHEGKIGEQATRAVGDEGHVDALAGLRAFALRHVSAHLSGQYGRLMLVRHGVGDEAKADSSCDVEDLTPLRRPLVLPKQADELARWLMPPAEPTQSYDLFKTTYENMMMTTASCSGDAVAVDA